MQKKINSESSFEKDELFIKKIHRGLLQSKNGQVTSHADAKKKFAKWFNKPHK